MFTKLHDDNQTAIYAGMVMFFNKCSLDCDWAIVADDSTDSSREAFPGVVVEFRNGRIIILRYTDEKLRDQDYDRLANQS